MAITAAQVKELRDKTGVGMMDAKKALVAVEGDTPDQAAAYAKVAPSGYPVVAR